MELQRRHLDRRPRRSRSASRATCTGVAFDPADPSRGYAVGKSGVLLRYGKSWDQDPLPAGLEGRSFTSIAFAGSEAIVAAGEDLLVEDGGGWHVDAAAGALLHSAPGGQPYVYAVAGLPDGGAVAAGRDIVIERDGGPGTPWRFSKQPIPGSTAIAAAAVRDGGVRAVVSVIPQLSFPPADALPEPDPNVPPPVLPPFTLPGDGYLLRETANGWDDEERTSFAGTGSDRPVKSDPVLALQLDSSGAGWAVGGWSGYADATGRGTSASGSSAGSVRARVRTASIARYRDASAAPRAASSQPVPMPAGPVRLAVAGNAECEEACSALARQGLGPDRTLEAALATVAGLAGGNGPRALLYTGNRVATGLGPGDAERYAALLSSQPGLPVYAALGADDAAGGSGVGPFVTSFGSFPAPFGAGAAPAGVSTAGIPGAPAGAGARTHYAFDSSGPGGTVRVVVIDNSLGSLAASDPYQNPPEAQLPWLEAVLADARAEGIPTVVMGNRSLNPNFTPRLNVASDGTEVARVLVDGGASAYLFDRPEENRAMRIPAGAATTIPSFGTGTLGYRSELSGVIGLDAADSLFGDSGVMLLELDAAQRDPATNRAPVRARLVPVIQDLSLEAIDGTLLRRSVPALFSGLGRRPFGGDRWGPASAGSGVPSPAGLHPLHRVPAGPVPGRRLHRPRLPRVLVHLLGPRHRRFRPPGPGLDQPPQALPGRQRQGRHRQQLRPALPLQRRHHDGDDQRRRPLLLRTGDGPGRERPPPLRHPAAAPGPLQAPGLQRHPAAPAAAPARQQPAARLHAARARAPAARDDSSSDAAAEPGAGDPAGAALAGRLPAAAGGAGGDGPGGDPATATAGGAAAAARRRPRPYLPGGGKARRGGGDRGVAGVLALRRARRRRPDGAALPAGPGPDRGDRGRHRAGWPWRQTAGHAGPGPGGCGEPPPLSRRGLGSD